MANEVELKRGKELFDALLRNEGLEAALLPFLAKYRLEDGKKYSFEILLKYLQIYKQSEYVSKEDANKYNKLRSISKTTLLKRGKEICDTQMANRFRVSAIEPLGVKYAKEDKRYLPYSRALLDRMRNAFLEIASQEYLEKYQSMCELSKRSTTDGLDFYTLKYIANLPNPAKALEYMNKNNIRYESFKALRNAYFRIYPDDLLTRASVNAIENLILLERDRLNKEKIKIANQRSNQEKHEEEQDKMKRILKRYIHLGKDDLEACIRDEDITLKAFFEKLNKVKKSEDEELKAIYQKYLEVEASFYEERKVLVETLLNYYQNGIHYGYKVCRFSLYEYYSLTNKSALEINKLLKTYLPMSLVRILGGYINNLTVTRKFTNRDELVEQINYKYPKIEAKEKDAIIDYIESQRWPYSTTLFKDIYDRLADGLITIPEKSKKSANNLYKL